MALVELGKTNYEEEDKKYFVNYKSGIDETNELIFMLKYLEMELCKNMIEECGVVLPETNIERSDIVFKNNVISSEELSEYDMSILDSIIIKWGRGVSGAFKLTDRMIDYLNDLYQHGDGKEKGILSHIPTTIELLDCGKAYVEAMVDIGIPEYAALAITGSFFVESGWKRFTLDQPFNIFNKQEASGTASAEGAKGAENCGESFFGITGWSQKVKCINDNESIAAKARAALGVSAIENNATCIAAYNKYFKEHSNTTWLSTLTYAEHFKLMLAYFKYCVPDYVRQNLLEDHESELDNEAVCEDIASTAFLYKAGAGETHGDTLFDRAVYRSGIYVQANSKTFNVEQNSGFGLALVCSWLVGEYISGSITTDDEVAFPFDGKPSPPNEVIKLPKK